MNPGEEPLTIIIEYPHKNPKDFKISGNIKRECVCEVLCDFIQAMICMKKPHKDAGKPMIDKDIYKLVINIYLSDDTFTYGYDCGCKGLFIGIIMNVIGQLDKEKAVA